MHPTIHGIQERAMTNAIQLIIITQAVTTDSPMNRHLRPMNIKTAPRFPNQLRGILATEQ
jgi:hypothetical protein